jgi:hypothetical protein
MIQARSHVFYYEKDLMIMPDEPTLIATQEG